VGTFAPGSILIQPRINEPAASIGDVPAAPGQDTPGDKSDRVVVAVEREANGELALTLHGRLDLSTLPSALPQLLDPIRATHPQRVIINAADLQYCDGIGLGILAEARRVLAGWGGGMRLENLRPELRPLIDMAALEDPSAPQLVRDRPPALPIAIGQYTADVFDELRETVGFLGHLTTAAAWSLLNPRRIRWRELLIIADKVGTDAVPVICLLGFLIGNILAFQAAPPVARLGGRDIIPTLVSISIVRELGPLIAAILMAGRTASAFAAELGTMTVTDEISALRAMGLDPVPFLAVPRAIAAAAVAPILAMFCNITGILGGYCIMTTYGFSFARYSTQVRQALTVGDLVGGELKTIVFGLIVGGVGCLRGLRTGAGPGAVGASATRAVVTSIVWIILADGAFGVAYYYLGF
jgi:phospholipid/cholesterol/gamma-HCH transport system permease protein